MWTKKKQSVYDSVISDQKEFSGSIRTLLATNYFTNIDLIKSIHLDLDSLDNAKISTEMPITLTIQGRSSGLYSLVNCLFPHSFLMTFSKKKTRITDSIYLLGNPIDTSNIAVINSELLSSLKSSDTDELSLSLKDAISLINDIESSSLYLYYISSDNIQKEHMLFKSLFSNRAIYFAFKNYFNVMIVTDNKGLPSEFELSLNKASCDLHCFSVKDELLLKKQKLSIISDSKVSSGETQNKEDDKSKKSKEQSYNYISFESSLKRNLERKVLDVNSKVKNALSFKLLLLLSLRKEEVENSNELRNYLMLCRNEIIQSVNDNFGHILSFYEEFVKTVHIQIQELMNEYNQILGLPLDSESSSLNPLVAFANSFNFSGSFSSSHIKLGRLSVIFSRFTAKLFSLINEFTNKCFPSLESIKIKSDKVYTEILDTLNSSAVAGKFNIQISEVLKKISIDEIKNIFTKQLMKLHLFALATFRQFDFGKVSVNQSSAWFPVFSSLGVASFFYNFCLLYNYKKLSLNSNSIIALNLFGILNFVLGTVFTVVFVNSSNSNFARTKEALDVYCKNLLYHMKFTADKLTNIQNEIALNLTNLLDF